MTTLCKHGNTFEIKDRCSLKYKCKIGSCSNQYPCRKEYQMAQHCFCLRQVESSSIPLSRRFKESSNEKGEDELVYAFIPRKKRLKESSNEKGEDELVSAFSSLSVRANRCNTVPIVGDPRQEAIERDRVYRSFIENNVWHIDEEFKVCQQFVCKVSKELFPEYPYVFAYEWGVSDVGHTQDGKGDIVLYDGDQRFLVVEVKYIAERTGKTARTRNRTHRRTGEDQVAKYTRIWQSRYPQYEVEGVLHTNQSTYFC
eukprot:TRINITY_DN235_c0_g1_i2.p1 TRINITY_DN235_c0_g1~~TRINITY_DN235_c0_g1_i2.p1  ORF type:complete len:256 (+),score=25.77 TRINITY_DN235_c0_g1_i2:315-1082(+)